MTILTVITLFAVNGVLAENAGTKNFRFELEPGNSWFAEVEITYVKAKANVSAKANQGGVNIEVFDPQGKKVARGTNKITFRSGKKTGKYKLAFKNNTNKFQKVVASYSVSGATDGS